MIYQKPVVGLLTGAILISFSSAFVKLAQVPSTVSAFYRVFFGCLFILAACIYQKEFKSKGWKKNLQAVACGLLFALDLYSWHKCIFYVGPGLATILGNFQVFVLSFIGIVVFKERTGLIFILSVPLAVLGLFLLIGVDVEHLSTEYLMGVGYGLATACFYGMFLLLLRNLQGQEERPPVFYYQMVLLAACSFFLGGTILLSQQSFAIPDIQTLASLLGLGLMAQAIGWVIITNFLPRVQAARAGLILLLQPALSFVWDVIFFQRVTGAIGWLGLLIVLTAIYLSTLRKQLQPGASR